MTAKKNKPVETDVDIKKNSELFLNKIESEMDYKSSYSSEMLSFEWLDELEFACPFIDNIMRNPKIALIKEENVVKIEKSKRIDVSSVKNLAKHTEYINKINKRTNEVEPERILDIRSEETYNTYENKFLYTLLHHLIRYIMKKEDILNNLSLSDEKVLEYAADTVTSNEKIHAEVRVTAGSNPTKKLDKKILEQVKEAKKRLKRVKDYTASWQRSEMIKALDNAHITLINPPIKKTNVILKNQNFKIAVKLWESIYSGEEDEEDEKSNLNSDGNAILKGFLDHSFLIDYFVLDSVNVSKREQKRKIAKRAILLLTEEIHRIISLLISMGVKIDDEQLLKMIAQEIKNERAQRLVGAEDVKKKFQSAMDDYLERTKEYL